jgi:hypothetical protein
MGLTTSVGTGLALAIEDSPVARTLVLDGDGSLLMNLGVARRSRCARRPVPHLADRSDAGRRPMNRTGNRSPSEPVAS